MVLLPNDVPKLSGSPRSNPSAGNTVMLLFSYGTRPLASRSCQGCRCFFTENQINCPRYGDASQRDISERTGPLPSFHSASFNPVPHCPHQRRVFFLWSNELLTCLSGGPSVVPDPLASPHTHPNCSLMKAERKPM